MRVSAAAVLAAALLGGFEAQSAAPAPEPTPQTRDIIRPESAPAATSDGNAGELRPAADPGELRFVLRGVEVEGASDSSRRAIESAFAPLLGREVGIEQLTAIADGQTARYRSAGEFLSQVLIPAQDIADGRVKVRAVEGYVANVHFRGALPENHQLLDRYAAQIEGARPLHAATLERQLLLMNDLGRSNARGTLVPSQTPGAADLIVDFERERVALTLATHNRASRSLGPQRIDASLGWYGALTTWDSIALDLGSTPDDELRYAGVRYRAPLGSHGMQWELGATRVRANPGTASNLTQTGLQTDSLSGLVQITWPLLRSRVSNLALRGALTSFDGQSEFDVAQLSNDRIRAAQFGFTFDHADALRGISMIEIGYARGLDSLGARVEGTDDSPLSRANGRADFSKVTAYAARLQSLGGPWSALLAFSGQHTTTPLLSSELFTYGGEPFGRGHDPAELTGDRGVAAKLELRYAASAPGVGLAGYTFYGFADWGRVRRLDPINELEREEASSCGAGMRYVRSGGRWQGFIEFALPLEHDVAARGKRDSRVFFGLQFNP